MQRFESYRRTYQFSLDVPDLEMIGPLFQRPMDSNQVVVMLLNPGYRVRSGSVLTVVLGKYK